MVPLGDWAKAQRILVVDDVADNAVLAERILTKAGFETQSCESGSAAFSKIDKSRPDLVLLDWMMPEMSGIEVLTALRKKWSAQDLPVIMCTSLGEQTSVVAAYGAGANDFVQKPFSSATLVNRVKLALLKSPDI